ncbi:MAG: prolipoprotein diacylglyceryl transferase [Chloroflexota bacterium]
MGPIVINIDPVLLSLGHIHIGWYGIIVTLAIAVGVWVATREAKRRGVSVDDTLGLASWAIVGGLIGARLFHVIDKLDYYIANPLAALAVWQGGLAIWGAIVGGAVAAALYARRHGLPLARLADAATPALLVGQMIGRFACVINGDSTGTPTDLPWAFVYVNPGAMVPPDLLGVPTHPYPVYEILWNSVVLGVVWILRSRVKREGILFLTYVSLYAVGRFALSFVRREVIWFGGLQEAQVMSVIVLIAAVVALVELLRRARPTVRAAMVKARR